MLSKYWSKKRIRLQILILMKYIGDKINLKTFINLLKRIIILKYRISAGIVN